MKKMLSKITKNTVYRVGIELIVIMIFVIMHWYNIISTGQVIRGCIILIIIIVYKIIYNWLGSWISDYIGKSLEREDKLLKKKILILWEIQKLINIFVYIINYNYDKFVKLGRWIKSWGIIGEKMMKVWYFFIYNPLVRLLVLVQIAKKRWIKRSEVELLWSRIEGMIIVGIIVQIMSLLAIRFDIYVLILIYWNILLFLIPLLVKYEYITDPHLTKPRWAMVGGYQTSIIAKGLEKWEGEHWGAGSIYPELDITYLEMMCAVYSVPIKKKANYFWISAYDVSGTYCNNHIISQGFYEEIYDIIEQPITCTMLYQDEKFLLEHNIKDAQLWDLIRKRKKIVKEAMFILWEIEEDWGIKEYRKFECDEEQGYVKARYDYSGEIMYTEDWHISPRIEIDKKKKLNVALENKILEFLVKTESTIIATTGLERWVFEEEEFVKLYQPWLDKIVEKHGGWMLKTKEYFYLFERDERKWRKEWEKLKNK